MWKRIASGVATALFALTVGASFFASNATAQMREVVLAEPVHGVSFLPIYIAKEKGYFKDEGINLTITVMRAGAFVSSVLTGDAFAFIGSVDHNAFAKAEGKELIAVSNLVARANIYMLARKDLSPVTGDIKEFVRGKKIAVATYGRTPNNMLRYLLAKWQLDPMRDVTLIEVDSPVIPTVVSTKRADIGVSSEPFISLGYGQGIWDQPFWNGTKELGPYADTALSVRADKLTTEPKLVRGLVKATIRGLRATISDPAAAIQFARKEFPTASEQEIKAALDRAFTDKIFSEDGFIPREAWVTGHDVVRLAGLLKKDIAYDEVINMRFVNEVKAELGIK